jgi:tRNA G18 (ribose-2'-O)-methylase SpoU
VKASAGSGGTERIAIAEVPGEPVLKAIRSRSATRACACWAPGRAPVNGSNAVDFKKPTALVVGAEGKGMREAVARRCGRPLPHPSAPAPFVVC